MATFFALLFIVAAIVLFVITVICVIVTFVEAEPAALLAAGFLFAFGCVSFNTGTDIHFYFNTQPTNEIVNKEDIKVYERNDGYYLNYKNELVAVTSYTGVMAIKEGDFQLYKQTYKNGTISLPSLDTKQIVQYKYFTSKGETLGQVPNLSR